MTNRKDLPSPSSPNFLPRVREELHALLGKTGSDRDRALTLRDALETGVLVPGPGGSLVPGGGAGGGSVEPYEPDLTPPPQPGAFTATPAISHILISQAQPAYTQGRGHGRTRVYGAQWVSGPLPVFADAVEVGQFSGTVWGMPSNPATTWHLWIKWESQDGAVSATPSGGTNGVVATTGQDVSSLLDALAGQISADELATSLATPIGQIPGIVSDLAQEAIDRAQGDAAEAAARSAALAQEAADRAAAITAEADARAAAIAAEADARALVVQQEVDARAAAIAATDTAIRSDLSDIEAAIRGDLTAADAVLASSLTASFQAGDAAALADAKAFTYSKAAIDSAIAAESATLTTAFNAADAATLASANSYTFSKSEINTAISAMGTQLTTNFTTADAATLASAQNFTYSRSAIDAADAATLDTLRAEYAAADTATLASAQNYTYAKATIDSAIATSASTLRAQITGGSTATDLNLLTSGLLYQERMARVSATDALTQQIALIEAGAGEQFDYSNIWYFDAGVESWTTNSTGSTLSAISGWLRLVSNSGTLTDRYFISPDNLGINGAKYPQVRLRVRKVGSPTWEGTLYFITATNSTYDANKSATIAEPTYDANGIGLVTFNMPTSWTGGVTIRQIRFDASTAITPTSYFELDWVAVGRPSPGASSAQLTAEQVARADGDNAQTVARETLAAQIRGGYTGNDINALSSGLLHAEREARVSADASQVTARETLATQLRGTYTGTDIASVSSGLIHSERQARSAADASEVSARQSLSAKLTGATDPTSLTLATLSSGLLYDERQARASADASEVTARETLATQLRGTYTGTDIAAVSSGLIHSERQARTTADATEVTARQALSAKLTGANDPASLTLGTLSSGLLFDERQARITQDNAQVGRIETLETTVNNPTTGVAATSTALDAVKLLVNNSTTGVTATANKTALLESKLSNVRDIFAETWDGPDPLSRWQSYDGAGEQAVVVVADGVGGKALRVGNNAGNDMRWLVHRDLIPFDTNKLYRMRVRLRRSLGSGTAYLGWVGVAADGVTLVNTSGTNVYYGAHYHTAANVSPGAAWTEYTGFTKGVGSGGTGGLASPGKIHTNVRYLRAMVLVNYNGAAGITEVGQITVDDAEVKEIESGLNTAIATKANQTALNDLSTRVEATEDDILIQGGQITALQGDLETVENGLTTKADAAVVNAIATRIESTTGNIVTSSGSTVLGLQNSISTADGKAVAAQTTANNAATAAATAQTAANTANTTLADIASDSKLTPSEKQAVRSEWNVVAAEKAGINAQATTFAITTENTAYNNAFQALANYLNNAATWSSGVPSWISDANLSTTTNIVGSTFRANWQNLYTARTALLNAIALKAKTLADAAQATANTKASASAFDTLNTQVQHSTTGLAATATRVGALETTVNNPTTGVAATAAALSTTNTNVSTLGGTVTAQGNSITTIQARVDRVVNYLIVARGTSATAPAGLKSVGFFNEAGTSLATNARSYMLVVLNGATGAVISSQFYDVYGNGASASGRNAATLADDLNALTNDKVVVVYTFDEPKDNRLTNGLEAAMYRCGASRSVFGASSFARRSAYILVGTPGIGEGGGIERYAGAIDNDPAAYCDYTLQLINGRPAGLGGNLLNAAIQTEATTRATQTGELFAKYTVKIDTNGYVSGFGLASTANNATPFSEFIVRADSFAIASPSGPGIAPAEPFIVRTTPTTIGGVSVPAGVYMADAFIQNGTITNAKIANLAVDDAKIASLSVSKLTAGSIAVGQYAQSTGYVAGSSGWRINGDGTAEFSGVVVRGTIFASQGAIGGWAIGSNYLQSTTYALGTSGTRLNSDGTGQIGGITIYSEGLGAGSTAYDTGAGAWIGRDGRLSLRNSSGTQYLKWDGSSLQISGALQAATGTFAGSLSAATGTFSGALSASTGTFSGSLTASAVNAVNTINLAGQAVTIPVGAYTDGASSQANAADRITVQSVTFMSTGAPVFVAGAFSYAGNSSCTGAYLRIYRNGSEIVKFVSRCAPGDGGSISGVAIDTPGAGPATYSIVLSAVAGIATSSNRSLFAMEVKR